MHRSNMPVTALLLALLFVPASFAGDGDTPKPPAETTAAPPAQTAAVPPAPVAPNVGAYPFTLGPFQYDPAGNITAIGNDYYLYDPLGRLVTAGVTRPDQQGTQTQTYTYDAYGNRTALNGAAQSASPTTNRLTSYGAVYDVAGNLTQWQPPGSASARLYTYDALGKLTKETTASHSMVHLYTADDERFWELEVLPNGLNRSHWTLRDLSGHVLRDFADDGTDTSPDWQLFREYVYREGTLLAINTSTGTQHVTVDHLGTPRLITDGQRYKLYNHYYMPFGEEWTIGTDPADPTTLRFTGHERDDDLLGQPDGTKDYMHARYYASRLGRFFSPDPVLGSVALPQSWNRYAYVRNSPLMLVDPDGRNYDWSWILFGIAYMNGWLWEPSLFTIDVYGKVWQAAAVQSAINDYYLLKMIEDSQREIVVYRSLDMMAMKALRDICKESATKDREMGGYLYRHPDGTFSTSEVLTGGRHDMGDHGNPENFMKHLRPPGMGKMVAIYHTHGDYNEATTHRYNDEEFSNNDRLTSVKMGMIGYLATPSGKVFRFIPSPDKTTWTGAMNDEGDLEQIGTIPCKF